MQSFNVSNASFKKTIGAVLLIIGSVLLAEEPEIVDQSKIVLESTANEAHDSEAESMTNGNDTHIIMHFGY